MNEKRAAKPTLTLKVLPVRKLGIDKALLVDGPVGGITGGCRASAGGSCRICCTGTS